jgi:hypothetical protein
MISNNQTEQIKKQEKENKSGQERVEVTQIDSKNLPNFPLLMQTEYSIQD